MASTQDPRQLVDEALAASDAAWPRAERALFEALDAGTRFESGARHEDPMGRFIAETVAGSTPSTRQALDKATAYLDDAARFFARTPAGTPRVAGVVANLSATFGSALTQPLAMRLVQQREMPHWQALSTLAYLARHPDPAVAPALVRYASVAHGTPQAMAMSALRTLDQGAVAAAVRAERERLRSTGGELPVAIAALERPDAARA